MADRDGSPIQPDGPLAAPVREAAPAPPTCAAGCGEPSHVGRGCRPMAERHWRNRALRAEAALAEAMRTLHVPARKA